MYSKALEAAGLTATYGLRESMPLAVPRRKVPPVLPLLAVVPLLPPLLPPQPGAVKAKLNAAPTSSSAASHFVLISPSLSVRERRFVHRQRACVRVERTTDPQRDGSLVLAVPERQLVEDGHAQRLQVLLQHVLDRLRGPPVRDVARQVAVVALVHVAHHDAGEVVELAGVAKLRQLAVDVVRRGVGVFEEEDRAVRLELPRRAERLQ